MATTKLNIGKIPISKGEYQEGTAYQRLNQVTMLGSTYQSKIDDNTSAPAQMGADGAVENINTDKWLCIAVGNVSAARKVVYNNETSGLEAGNVQEAIDEVGSKVSDLTAGISHESVQESDDCIEFASDSGKVVGKIDKDGADFTSLKRNGVEVITEHQDISGLATKKEVEEKESHNMNLSNVSFIPIFGQSLSVGAAATPVITTKNKYPAALMFNIGIRCSQKSESSFTSFIELHETEAGKTNDSAGVGETVASGCVEQLIELICRDYGINPYSSYWDNHKFLFGSFGSGSKTIAMLTETPESGIGFYQGVVNAMKAAKRICDEKGWTLNIPAWIWIQGETDQKMKTPKADYKEALVNLAKQFDIDAKAVTGQDNEVKCICYQTASQNIVGATTTPMFASTAMDIPTAQMELVRDNGMFVASAPVYILDHSEKEPIHLSATGEKMLGLYCGKALKSVLDSSFKQKGITPQSFLVSENNITIKCSVPCPPLHSDTYYVNEVENFGFKVLNSSNLDIISSVKLFFDEIRISCSESPIGCKLMYGFNGTKGKDGRIEGSRGNVCDNGNHIYHGDINSHDYTLANYLYSFIYTIEH